MFKAIRSRMHLSPSAAIATLALVFAMSGGAYAAGRYLVTSTKQISPKVLKQLHGATGPAGAAGPAGAQGGTGPQGPAGPVGPQGNDGPQGKEGTAGKNGEKGKEGKEGSPWTLGGTLPVGKTETGSWAFAAASEVGVVRAPISFPIQLAKVLEPSDVHFVTLSESFGGTAPAGCSGTPEKPTARSGELCVYAVGPSEATFIKIVNPGSFGTEGAATAGAYLEFKTEVGESKEPKGWGNWAVTG
ncbi:MAG TPA: hypothetical protein VGL57_10540 [Solirubrobacteraceae bacterium]|jgi:hypothetical protein